MEQSLFFYVKALVDLGPGCKQGDTVKHYEARSVQGQHPARYKRCTKMVHLHAQHQQDEECQSDLVRDPMETVML